MDVYGLIGKPVGHSLSPAMHEAAYQTLGIDAKYVVFEPDPADLSTAIEGAAALGIRGLNVTIPFKQDVLDFVDPDRTAVEVGAVNTIDFSHTPPTGHNTDVDGVHRSLERYNVTLDNTKALIVGAGGAARAVAYVLEHGGAESIILNRTPSRAIEIADDLPNSTGGGLDQLETVIGDVEVVVNATSVGMESNETPIPAELLHEQLTVMDVVYRPLQTRLLRDAEAVGAITIDGAWMLLYQGVAAFELWTGQPAPVEEMNNALRDRLTA